MSCEFLTLFGSIPDEAIQTRLPADTTVERVQIFKNSRTMRLHLAFPVLVKGVAVDDVAAALKEALQLDTVEIDVQMPPESFHPCGRSEPHRGRQQRLFQGRGLRPARQ